MAYAKSIVAALVAVLSSLVTALGDNFISTQEWLTAVIAGLVAFSAVWSTPHYPFKKTPTAPSAPTTAPPSIPPTE